MTYWVIGSALDRFFFFNFRKKERMPKGRKFENLSSIQKVFIECYLLEIVEDFFKKSCLWP